MSNSPTRGPDHQTSRGYPAGSAASRIIVPTFQAETERISPRSAYQTSNMHSGDQLDSQGVLSGQHTSMQFGTPGGNNPRGAGQSLSHVAERFSAFYTDLESEKQQRREAEANRRQSLVDQVQKLERNLEAEMKRRTEADKGLQSHIEGELKALNEKHQMQMREMQMGLKASIDALSRTFAELHNGLREEKEQRRVDNEHLLQSVMQRIDETQAGLDDERVARLEREAQTLKRVGEDIFRVQEKVDAERVARESSTTQLHSELQETISGRSVYDEKFQQACLGEIASLKSALQMEREERIAEDEQIVHAINDYTRALQDGLRIVNTA